MMTKKAADSDDDYDNLVAADGTSAMTVEDTGAFDCGVCYLPFKPPIFQCIEGHAVCSTCRDKLMATGNTRCHVCRVDLLDGHGFFRSHSLERMVESVRVPCPHAAYGCAARPVYYDRSAHRRTCPYRPLRCPFRPCDFVGTLGQFRQHALDSGPHHIHERVNTKHLMKLIRVLREQSVAVAEDGEEDNGGLPPFEVELVVQCAGGVSRDKAITALRESGGYIVGAIKGLLSSQQSGGGLAS